MKAFVGRIADKIKEFIFRGALKAVGAPVEKVMGVLNKGADVIKTIISDPIGFFRNLAAAVGGGIKRFVGNIKTHLISGLIDWLTGAMSEVPITLPAKFDLKGILDLVLQKKPTSSRPSSAIPSAFSATWRRPSAAASNGSWATSKPTSSAA